MAKMIMLVDEVDGWVCAVNPDNIRVMRPNPTGGTDIQFARDHIISVKEVLETVVLKIE